MPGAVKSNTASVRAIVLKARARRGMLTDSDVVMASWGVL